MVACTHARRRIPPKYLRTVQPLIPKARELLESGEKLAVKALVGKFTTGQFVPVPIDTRLCDERDAAADDVRQGHTGFSDLAAQQVRARAHHRLPLRPARLGRHPGQGKARHGNDDDSTDVTDRHNGATGDRHIRAP